MLSLKFAGLTRIVVLSCVAAMFLFVPQQDAAVNANLSEIEPADKVYTSITQTQLKSIMTDEGYSYTSDSDGDLVWKINGFKSLLIVYTGGTSLQFHVSFADTAATLRKVNTWNQTKRYSTSYIDDDGDPVLTSDLDLEGGVTRSRIIDYIRTCRQSFEAWHTEVVK